MLIASKELSHLKIKISKKLLNILDNFKNLQLSPSVLEELVQKHYKENKKIFLRRKSFEDWQWIIKYSREMNL